MDYKDVDWFFRSICTVNTDHGFRQMMVGSVINIAFKILAKLLRVREEDRLLEAECSAVTNKPFCELKVVNISDPARSKLFPVEVVAQVLPADAYGIGSWSRK